MTHPYIDCARRLGARGIKPDDIAEMVCEVGEGTVHRLWEPLAAKQTPHNGYAGKFSTPYCIAAGFVRGNVGLERFHRRGGERSGRASRWPQRCATGSIPHNPYPDNFTGHIRATLARRQRDRGAPAAHARRRARAADARRTSRTNSLLNARHGGWDDARARSRRWSSLRDAALTAGSILSRVARG